MTQKISSPILIAKIFSLWSMLKADITKSPVKIDFYPHPAQIVAILLLIGDNDKI
jgi:hypothetical protein